VISLFGETDLLYKQYIDLLILGILSIVFSLMIIFLPAGFVRIISGLLLVLFFPGYMLVSLFFPERSGLGSIERIALSFGISIAVVSLLGLILNYTTVGLGLISILTSLVIFIITIGIAAFIRRYHLPEYRRFTCTPCLYWKNVLSEIKEERPEARSRWLYSGLLILLFIAVVTCAGAIIFTITTMETTERFTEFYILGVDGKAQNYDRQIKYDESVKVIVGIINTEQEATSYRLTVNMDNTTTFEIPLIVLNTKEKWEQVVEFKPTSLGLNQKVEYQLYKNDLKKLYSTLFLWVDVVMR